MKTPVWVDVQRFVGGVTHTLSLQTFYPKSSCSSFYLQVLVAFGWNRKPADSYVTKSPDSEEICCSICDVLSQSLNKWNIILTRFVPAADPRTKTP